MLFLFMVVLVFGGFTIYYNFYSNGHPGKIENPLKPEKPTLKIVNEDSKTRPIAVMINNNQAAWKNHSGLQDAYLVYEIITEGGITRLMALYKDQTTERIGSVRSARHYFLDYVLENDAIYAHFGWSPKAQSDIASLEIENINGLYDNNAYYRDTTLGVAYEHTAYTSCTQLNHSNQSNHYRTTTGKGLLLPYSIKEIDYQAREDSQVAKKIEIPYSNIHTTSYIYNEVTKNYERYMNGIPHQDGISHEVYHVKNIIIAQVENYSMDQYGRQDLQTVGTGSGYYITNGYAIPITWKKESRSAKTKYYDLDGNNILLNDGNTFIQIQPTSKVPVIEAS